MDIIEAKSILEVELTKYRQKSYGELKRLLREQDTFELVGATGQRYQLEFQAVWDSWKNGNLRIMGSIDDGGAAALRPLTLDFILSPAGQFIGE
jgi:hypothetical protein